MNYAILTTDYFERNLKGSRTIERNERVSIMGGVIVFINFEYHE